MKLKNLSKKIFNSGKIITFNGKNLKYVKKNKNKLIELFKENGVLVFKDLEIEANQFKDLTDIFSATYANDAARREKTKFHPKINSVDIGNNEMSLHSEASFSPSWPEILWFYCLEAPKKNGETTLCDGLKLWQSFTNQIKDYFLRNPLKFSLSIPIMKPKKSNEKKNWPLNNIGSFNSFLNYKTGNLEFDQIKFAVTESRLSNDLCFSNHVMYKDTDETIKKWGTISNKKIPSKIIKYIEKQADKLKVFYKWKKNEIIMLDNRRFLHGRNFFSKNEKRKIINIQTLKANFSYEHIKNI